MTAKIIAGNSSGRLTPGNALKICASFMQPGGDKSEWGLDLSNAGRNILAKGDLLTVKDAPDIAYTFPISMPRYSKS